MSDLHPKIQEVVEHFGSKSNLARALGVSRASISEWVEDIPEGRCYQIQVLTGGKIKAHELPIRKPTYKASP